MKNFLLKNFGVTKVSEVDKDALKQKLEGEKLVERIGYRRKVALNNHTEAIAKGAIIRTQNKFADDLRDGDRNFKYGFPCLHYSVSEGAGGIKIQIQNKSGKAGKIVVRTRDDTASAGNDYEGINQVLEFKDKEMVKEILIKIFDDDEWEPDEDFFVDLFEIVDPVEAPANKVSAEGLEVRKMIGGDTTTRVTIIDDDKPG